MREFIVLCFVLFIAGCSSLKGMQRETCEAAAAVVVPLFCPIQEDNDEKA